jgi:hypothetical protein
MRTQELLTEDLHLRVSKQFHERLHETAEQHHLKPSAFTRHLLMKYLPDYEMSHLSTETHR